MAASKTSAAASTAKKTSPKTMNHPTFVDMITQCIKENKDSARTGVSRPTIKKFLASTYKLDMSTGSNISNLSKAITRGEEIGVFLLPKGASGCVKLAKPSADKADKENVKPISSSKKPVAAKSNAKAPLKPKAPAPKTAADKKPAVKKEAIAKKPVAAKSAKATTTTKTKSSTSKAATAPKAKASAAAKKTPTAVAKKPAATKKSAAPKAAATVATKKAAPAKKAAATAPKKKAAAAVKK